jgi:hypothetical protein
MSDRESGVYATANPSGGGSESLEAALGFWPHRWSAATVRCASSLCASFLGYGAEDWEPLLDRMEALLAEALFEHAARIARAAAAAASKTA